MAKQVTAQIRLQVPGGSATPAPPVGPALGQHGVNIGQFVSRFNDQTKDMKGITVPVVITVYSDRSFDFIVKSPPAAVLLKQAAGIPMEKKKGGEVINGEEKQKKSGKYKGFKVTPTQVRDIAQKKLADLNARNAIGDLLIYVSDNESWIDSPWYGRFGGTRTETLTQWAAFKARNPKAKLVCIDLQPYATTQAAEREDILNIGGFSDHVFDVIAAFAKGTLNTQHWVGVIEAVKL